MARATQERVNELWQIVNTENLNEISDWAGTLETLRRPMVLKGLGMSKASIMGERKLRRIST